MKTGLCTVLMMCIALSAFAAHRNAKDAARADLIRKVAANSSDDYAFMWWAEGWRGRKIRCVQTNHYGMAMDTDAVAITHFGEIAETESYEDAVKQSNDAVLGLPAAKLELIIQADGKRHKCTGGGHPRLIESGRFLQRADIESLVFKTAEGEVLAADCRLEIVAWPDRLAVGLDIVPREDVADGVAFITFSSDRPAIEVASAPGSWRKGEIKTISTVLYQTAHERAYEVPAVTASEIDSDKALSVVYDAFRGWHDITLPANNPRSLDKSHLDRVLLHLSNPDDVTRTIRLNLSERGNVSGITGLVPMLRDMEGNPTGIPVQISKNWHKRPEQSFLYEGPWLHALTALTLPARSTLDLEFTLAQNSWGQVPLASHAQLCLIGWGVDQLWDQAAIGSWGESVCYDPDICLERSMIDDVRPLMVTQMGSTSTKWGWTNNVGGGDFLVYYSEDNNRQFLSRMRTAYNSGGPNLTDVVYSGVSADGNIAATVRVQTPRCDDINRAWHTFRYDVLKPTRFARLAFYQVGADNYNDQEFHKLARGNESGLLEEWDAVPGGRIYHRAGIDCPGELPWFSLHQAVNADKAGGAWANRGLVIRSWSARLGGKEAAPFAASYGTENGPHSCNIELTPPPGIDELLPGDFVEATVELLVLPQKAGDYYGPNESLRNNLITGADTWKPVLQQATGGALRVNVSRGKLIQSLPIRIKIGAFQVAKVSIEGGLGYAPITFEGLRDHRGWELLRKQGGEWTTVDQSVFGNDFWQVDRDGSGGVAITYNVPLDSEGGAQEFMLRRRKT